MESNQEFERYIKDSLSNIDKEPKLEVWNRIEQTLDAKKKRKILPFKFIGLGFITAFMLFFVYEFTSENSTTFKDVNSKKSNSKNSNSNINGNATESNSDIKDDQFQKDGTKHEGFNTTNKNSANENSNPTILKNNTKQTNTSKNILVKNKKNRKLKTKKDNQAAISAAMTFTNYSEEDEKSSTSNSSNLDFYKLQKESTTHANTTETSVLDSTKTVTATGITEIEKEKITDSIFEKTPTWSISVYAAPTVYNTFSKSSIVDRNLSNENDSSELTWSYGGYYNIDINKKFGMRLGLLYSTVEINTKNIPIYDSFGNVTQFNQFSNLQLNQGITNQTLADYFPNAQELDFITKIAFVEMPFELRYRLIDKKFIIDGFGGFGFMVINQNEVQARDSFANNLLIGELSIFDKLLFSSNLGASASYPLTKDIRIFLNPTFNYQFTELKSYSFLLKSGFIFSF